MWGQIDLGKVDISNSTNSKFCNETSIFKACLVYVFALIYLDRYSFVVFNGKQQHGYKKNKGTLTLGLQLQSLTARALDDSNYVLMASLDLSAAFDVVNKKRLTNILCCTLTKGDECLQTSL